MGLRYPDQDEAHTNLKLVVQLDRSGDSSRLNKYGYSNHCQRLASEHVVVVLEKAGGLLAKDFVLVEALETEPPLGPFHPPLDTALAWGVRLDSLVKAGSSDTSYYVGSDVTTNEGKVVRVALLRSGLYSFRRAWVQRQALTRP